MVKMRAFIQRLKVECQKEINTESLYDFWSENLEGQHYFLLEKNGKGTF